MAWYGSGGSASWAPLVLLLLLVVLLLPGCIQSDPGPAAGTLEEHASSFTGDSWVAWHVTIPADATAEFHVQGDREGSSLTAFGIWTLRAEDRDLDSLFVASTMSPHRETRHLQLVGEEGTVFSKQRGTQQGGWGGWAEIRPRHDLELIVVMLAGSDQGLQGEFTLKRTPDVAVHAPQTTGGARLVSEREFTGHMNLLLEDEVAGREVHTKVIRDATFTVPTENRLFGAFKGEVRSGSLSMAYETGTGSRTHCTPDHAFPYTCFLSGRSDGDHTLRIIENIDRWERDDCTELPMDLLELGVGCEAPPIVWALVADVRLPVGPPSTDP